MSAGYLSLHIGCMRAEKSVMATRRATKYADLGEKVLYVRSALDLGRDTDGGDATSFTSHSSSNKYLSEKVDKVSCTLLSEVDAQNYDRIVIDEAQFFEDIVESVLHMVDTLKKAVHVVGLDSSYKRTKIGNLLDLIPHADYYEKFTAKCVRCLEEHKEDTERKYRDAPFTLLERDSLADSHSDVESVGTHPERIVLQSGSSNIIKPGNRGYIPVCRYHYNQEQERRCREDANACLLEFVEDNNLCYVQLAIRCGAAHIAPALKLAQELGRTQIVAYLTSLSTSRSLGSIEM